MAKTISDCSISISNSVSKVDAEEEMSSFLDRLGDLAGDRPHRRPISNEKIGMGEELLGIYMLGRGSGRPERRQKIITGSI